MNNAFYSIINYIFYRTLNENDMKNHSNEITRDLLDAGFDSDDINQAYHFLGYYLKDGLQDQEDLHSNNIDLFIDSKQDIIESLNNLLTLLRETNFINDQQIINAFDKFNDLNENIDDPEKIYEILDGFFSDYFDAKAIDDILLITPLAFQYRDV